MNRQSRGC